MDHDWHTFDDELGYEVARDGENWLVRHVDRPAEVTTLTDDEFEAWRTDGVDNPQGLL